MTLSSAISTNSKVLDLPVTDNRTGNKSKALGRVAFDGLKGSASSLYGPARKHKNTASNRYDYKAERSSDI